MSEDSILGIPNPLEVQNPLETGSQGPGSLASNRARRQAQKPSRFTLEEEDSEIVDDVDWEPPTQKKKVTHVKRSTMSYAPVLATATSSFEDDPLTCPEEPACEESAKSDGPLYKDVRRKPQGTSTIFKSDDLIYCFDCLRDYEGDCPEHGPLSTVKDTPILASAKDEFRARKTTPPVVSVAYSKIPGAKTGVWACKAIPKRTRFGPYEGKMVSPDEATSYSWLVRKNGKPHHCIDASEPGISNWMRFINNARHIGERNLQAFQYQSSIFFQTSRNVLPHEELLVWFGEENDSPQQSKPNAAEKKPQEFKEAVFKCPACPYAYASPLYLARHTKYCRHLNAPKAKKPSTESTDATTGLPTIDTSSSTVKVYPKEGNRRQPKYGEANRVTSSNAAPQAREKVTALPLQTQPQPSQSDSEDSSSRQLAATKPFQCTTNGCDERFHTQKALRTHTTSHEKAPYQCPECDSTFFSEDVLQKHMESHPAHPFQCSECGERFSHEETLSSHVMTHAGENPLVCCVCSERFFDKETLTSHLRIHTGTGNDSFACNQCNELFFDKALYDVHLQTHPDSKPYACTLCPKRFARADHAERHQASHSPPVYECPECPNRYNNLGHFNNHLEKHKGEHPYKCDRCDKQFILKSLLTQHLASHSDSKAKTDSHECPTCHRSFGGKGALSTHQLTHTRAAKCHICMMTFKTKCSLGFHMKACHPPDVENVVVTPEVPAVSPEAEPGYVESNYVSCDGDSGHGGSVLPDGYDEPEIDLCEANIKREIEVSETKFLSVSENTLSSEVEEPETLIPEPVTYFHNENLQTVIKSEVGVPQPESPAQVDLSPHTIIKSEIDDPES